MSNQWLLILLLHLLLILCIWLHSLHPRYLGLHACQKHYSRVLWCLKLRHLGQESFQLANSFLHGHQTLFIVTNWSSKVFGSTVAGVPTGRSLAPRPPAATGMATRPSDNLRLPPAFRFHLQASSTQTHAHTTGHKTPPVGVQSQGTHKQVHMHKPNDNAGTRFPGVKELQQPSRRIQYLTPMQRR